MSHTYVREKSVATVTLSYPDDKTNPSNKLENVFTYPVVQLFERLDMHNTVYLEERSTPVVHRPGGPTGSSARSRSNTRSGSNTGVWATRSDVIHASRLGASALPRAPRRAAGVRTSQPLTVALPSGHQRPAALRARQLQPGRLDGAAPRESYRKADDVPSVALAGFGVLIALLVFIAWVHGGPAYV